MTSRPARSTGHLITFSVLGILNQDTIINIFKSIFAFTNVLIPMLSFLGVHYIGLQVKMHVFLMKYRSNTYLVYTNNLKYRQLQAF